MHPTCFSQILGNEKIKKQLNEMLSKKVMGHSLLFAGPEGIGKSLFAWALAAQLMEEKEHLRKIQSGQHPDVHVYRPEGKLGLHSIQSLRQLTEEVYLPPYEAPWKVFIIHEADRMLSYSANALLKTFEEPPARTLIILLSRSQAVLLPTILSRCCTLHFQSLSDVFIRDYLQQHYQLENLLCESIVRQAQGSLGRAVRLAKQGDALRVAILHVLTKGTLGNYRLLQESVQKLSEQVDLAKKQVEEGAKENGSPLQGDHLSGQQQHALEKELEGLTALAFNQEARALLEHILSWYRDLQVLLLGGSPTQLMNVDFHPELQQAVQRGDFKPLMQVYAYIEEAYLALQRSTPLALCLENLLLKLDRV